MNNYSRQREVILDILKNNYTHPTALELYEIVHLKYPKISKSTLYRNLNILVNKGLVKSIKVLHGANRFDYVTVIIVILLVKYVDVFLIWIIFFSR